MITVDQTQFMSSGVDEKEVGNCWSACIASILEIGITDVPVFAAYEDWWERTFSWLGERGYMLEYLRPELLDYLGIKDLPLCIATGKSPRGDFNHSVVWLSDKMVHDPHFSRAGIEGNALELSFIYRVES